MPSDQMKKMMKDFLKGYHPLVAEVNGIRRPIAHNKNRTVRWVIRNEKQRLRKIDGIAKDREIMDAILGECDLVEVLDVVEGCIYRISAQDFVKYRRPFYADSGGHQYIVNRSNWSRESTLPDLIDDKNKPKAVPLF